MRVSRALLAAEAVVLPTLVSTLALGRTADGMRPRGYEQASDHDAGTPYQNGSNLPRPMPPNQSEGTVKLLPISIVHEFGVGTFVENIAVRSNGLLLVTTPINGQGAHELVQVDPFNRGRRPVVVARFPFNCTGIVEVERDVFYISVVDLVNPPSPSSALYRVDVGGFAADSGGAVTHPADVQRAVALPNMPYLNGATIVDRARGILLVGDAALGTIFRVDVRTGAVRVLVHSSLLQPRPTSPIPGVNGIRVRDGVLYAANSGTAQLLQAPIDAGATRLLGPLQVLQENLVGDDFALDAHRSIYLTTHIFNSVVKIDRHGARTRIAGGPASPLLAGSSSAAFGRTARDRAVLYVTSDGGLVAPVVGVVRGGKILAIQGAKTA
ncbi:MAG: hypothetical protein M1826_005530 [Phylliscum demangeonii]|nr:MAG: hypothetical protein M1826_005530 [Phylliscum demangeonii]